jgi:hypothetical protein
MLNHYREGEVVEEITTVGIDLAKNVFSVHAVGSQGEVVVRRTLSRAKLSELIAQLPPCLRGGLDFSDTGISGFLPGPARREDHAKTET